ncbi:chitin synthase-domain-containing protein [Chytridium lagenaria]|nr:chitin synthase-domain-containing protein [Chytridium lagenaria]
MISLKRTFESVAQSTFDRSQMLLFVTADGIVTGSGNDKPTPEIILDFFGLKDLKGASSFAFESLGNGSKKLNYGKIFSCYYRVEGQLIPVVIVVKVGSEKETAKPGNRGKRDSQLLLMRFLHRAYLKHPMNPLELELMRQFHASFGLDPAMFEFLLWVDADTEVHRDSVNRMVSSMVRDSKVSGLCGETLLANEKKSWVTMIQVYEYFVSHHLSKAFESLFGAVTCLPGFLIASPVIKDFSVNTVDTLHLKNLLYLGEDRYLTLLVMKHFPDRKLIFTSDAKCKTYAPEKLSVLVSQRRRWINSTVHTLLEMLTLKNTCGCCIFSMKSLVMLDLIGTFVQPCALIYIGYLVYAYLSDPSLKLPLVSMLMLAVVYGGQMIIFVLKGKFQHFGWMIIYILATPLFSFYLPLYAFWHFDDFTWGNTRIVMTEGGEPRTHEGDEEDVTSLMPSLQAWD